VTGLSFAPGDVDGLARAVRDVLSDPTSAATRARAAKERLGTDFDWATIASGTAEVYAAAEVREPRVLGRPKIATGNLFT
jgi:glycogen(starch) synthase